MAGLKQSIEDAYHQSYIATNVYGTFVAMYFKK